MSVRATINGPLVITFDCRYHRVEPVTLLDGEVVRYLCVDCDEVLPINYDCDDCMWVSVETLSDDRAPYVLGRVCPRHA